MNTAKCVSLALTFALLLTGSCTRASGHSWPDVFDPFQLLTLNIEVDPDVWEDIKQDTNFYDKSLNIRVPCLMWADGETDKLVVQIRRKADAALPSEDNPQKVSLKIDINEYVKGQEWRGLKKLSLESGGGGNGVVREGLAMNLHRLAWEQGFYNYSAGYASWVRLVVNGEYIGVYASPEQRDKQFLRNRGMYKPGASWLYEINGGIFLDQTIASTHSPTHERLCYSPFREACTQPDLEEELAQWIDMQGMLTLAAIEAFIANGDGLFTKNGKNSFAVDLLPPNQHKRMYFPWDLDAGFNNVNFDIYSGGPGPAHHRKYQTEILGHPWFRQQYRHIFSDLLDGPLSTQVLTEFIDRLEETLTPALLEDQWNSFDNVAAHFEMIRQFFTNRVANVRTQIGAVTGPPRFSQNGGEIIPGFELDLTHSNGSGKIYFTLDGSDPRGPGGAPAGMPYAGRITLTNTVHVSARVLSGTNWSALRETTFNLANHAGGIRITEIMYHPADASADGDGSRYEFIELKNTAPNPIDLSNASFSGIGFTFAPGTVVAPGEFIVLVRHPTAFAERYPGVSFHGVFFGKLSKSGERIRLRNSDGNDIVSARYSPEAPWPQGPRGLGYSLVIIDPDAAPSDLENWRASTHIHGSPGADDPAPPYQVGVVINEVLAHTDPPVEDAIELFNRTGNDINISGWFLSDRINHSDPERSLKRYRIPNGTIVPAGGYKVFYEAEFNPPTTNDAARVTFGLSSKGEAVYLSSADAAGNLTGHIIGVEFGASDNGVSFGRYRASRGMDFTALAAPTFGVAAPASLNEFRLGTGAANAPALVGPVVINEIMYHPEEGGAEYIELHNISEAPVAMENWDVRGAGAFVFPANSFLTPGGFVLLINTNSGATAAEFRAQRNVPLDVPIFEHGFRLSNSGELLRLRKPDDNPAGPRILVDWVQYDDSPPWPTPADGSGFALERFNAAGYGNEPLNWRTANRGGSPGRPNEFSAFTAIARNSSWRCNDLGWNLGFPWRSLGYSDNGWRRSRTPALTGGSTVYLRQEFAVSDLPAGILRLELSVPRAGEFTAWINGIEVARRSQAAKTTLNSAGAQTADFEAFDLTSHADGLFRGKNVLAVELVPDSPGLAWDAELVYWTGDPDLDLDSDGDGMPDWWEDLHGLDKFDPTDAAQDADLDGMSNLEEYLAGTDPRDPESNLSITSISFEGAQLTVQWEAVPGKTYRVQHSAGLANWSDLGPSVTANRSLSQTAIDSGPASGFYRVRLD